MRPTLPRFTFGLVPLIFALAYGTGFAQLTKIENKLPKSVPLKVEIKHYDSENWVHDLEIEVTNVGKKPIYYLSMLMILNVESENGNPLGFTFRFGNGRLYSTEALAKDDDPPILPGESFQFRTVRDQANAWDLGKRTKANFYAPSKGELHLGWLSFGDGTGIEGGGTTLQKKAILDRKP